MVSMWLKLVPDIWYAIYRHLSIPDCLALMQSCTTLYTHGKNHIHIWESHVNYLRQYDHQGLLGTLNTTRQKDVVVGYAKLQYMSRKRFFTTRVHPCEMNSHAYMSRYVAYDVYTYLSTLPVAWLILYMCTIKQRDVSRYSLVRIITRRHSDKRRGVHVLLCFRLVQCGRNETMEMTWTYDEPGNCWHVIPDKPTTWKRGQKDHHCQNLRHVKKRKRLHWMRG